MSEISPLPWFFVVIEVKYGLGTYLPALCKAASSPVPNVKVYVDLLLQSNPSLAPVNLTEPNDLRWYNHSNARGELIRLPSGERNLPETQLALSSRVLSGPKPLRVNIPILLYTI